MTSWHIDSIEITWDREQIKPKLTVNAHKHEAGTNHATGSCRTYTATVTIAAVAFGVPADLGGVALASGATVDFRSATYTLGVTHIDEPGRSGEQLAGENHDGVETLEVEFTGDATADDCEIKTGWTNDQKTTTPSNTAAPALVAIHIRPSSSMAMSLIWLLGSGLLAVFQVCQSSPSKRVRPLRVPNHLTLFLSMATAGTMSSGRPEFCTV